MQLLPQGSNAQVTVIFVKIIVQPAAIKKNILVKKYSPIWQCCTICHLSRYSRHCILLPLLLKLEHFGMQNIKLSINFSQQSCQPGPIADTS
jgi:hypothetical protein